MFDWAGNPARVIQMRTRPNCSTALLLMLAGAVPALSQTTRLNVLRHSMGETVEQWNAIEPNGRTLNAEPHRLGESLSDWLSLNRLSIEKVCNARKYAALCSELSTVNSSGAGIIETKEKERDPRYWRFKDRRLLQFRVGNHDWESSTYTKPSSDRDYEWFFCEGILCGFEVVPIWRDFRPDFATELEQLKAAYGELDTTSKSDHVNEFGVHWATTEARWVTRDQTVIVAGECADFAHHGKLENVVFVGREWPGEPTPAQTNPYLVH